MLRTVTGRISKIDGSPWATEIAFRLHPGSYDLDSLYPSSVKQITSGSDGLFSVALWCNTEGLAIAQYECVIGRDRFLFDLPSGTEPIDIGNLRFATNPIAPVAPIPSTTVRTFTQLDLTEDEIVVSFSPRNAPVSVTLANNLSQKVDATDVLFLSNQAVRVSLRGYTPINGLWSIRVL